MRRNAWVAAAWIVAAWGLLGLAFLPQFYLLGRTPDLASAAWRTASIFGLWALLTPFVAWLVRRFPLRTGVWLRHGVVLAVAGVVVVTIHTLLAQLLASTWTGGLRDRSVVDLWRGGLVGMGATNLAFYAGLLAVLHVRATAQRLRSREVALAQARLSLLQGQLQPHFLFNVLNALSELAYRDAARTDHLLTRLAQLLRATLHIADTHERHLSDEIEFMNGYLDLEKALLDERLDVRLTVRGDLGHFRVPVLLLQPVVENAIRHGIAPMRRPGRLAIDIHAERDLLHVRVADDGLGRRAPPGKGSGLGLSSLDERLRTLYGTRRRLSIDYPPDGGCVVDIELPLRP